MYDDIGRLNYGDKPAVGSQSIACLSCHDANQAFSVTKLSLDHPFGVPYRGFLKGQGVRGQPGMREEDNNEGSKSAKQLVSLDDFREPSQGVVDNRTVWWVSSTGHSALRTRGDLPLYLRRDTNNQDVPFIECSSCHDPHSSNPLFLRVTNEGSRLCLTCHDK
jgi:predicted CXXCH cytochrome family protein